MRVSECIIVNEMMDVFKDYSSAGGIIILGDAGLMIASALVAMFLKSLSPEAFAGVAIGTSYVLPYSLYTFAKV